MKISRSEIDCPVSGSGLVLRFYNFKRNSLRISSSEELGAEKRLLFVNSLPEPNFVWSRDFFFDMFGREIFQVTGFFGDEPLIGLRIGQSGAAGNASY